MISLLARLALEILGAALGLQLLVVEQVAGGAFDLALQLLAGAAGALGCLGALLARLALQLLGAALGLHLLIINHVAGSAFNLTLQLFGLAFHSLFIGSHGTAPL